MHGLSWENCCRSIICLIYLIYCNINTQLTVYCSPAVLLHRSSGAGHSWSRNTIRRRLHHDCLSRDILNPIGPVSRPKSRPAAFNQTIHVSHELEEQPGQLFIVDSIPAVNVICKRVLGGVKGGWGMGVNPLAFWCCCTHAPLIH